MRHSLIFNWSQGTTLGQREILRCALNDGEPRRLVIRHRIIVNHLHQILILTMLDKGARIQSYFITKMYKTFFLRSLSLPYKTTIMKNAPFTPKGYLKSGRALKLPVYKFYTNKDWREDQKFNLLFSRQHVNGNITFALLLVDLLCTGIKDALYDVNVPLYEFEEYVSKLKRESPEEIVEISHHLAHNMIYAALEYAEENGIAPHEDFKLASLIIGPDNEDIPLIDDIPFGDNGIPYLEVDHLDPKLSYYLSQLRKTRGEGNFKVVIGDMDYEGDEDEDFEREEEFDPLADMEAEISSWDERDWEEYLTSNLDAADFSLDDFLELNQVLQTIYKKHIWPGISKRLPLDKIRCAEEIDLTEEPIDSGYDYIFPKDVENEIYEIFQLISDTEADKLEVRKSISQLDRYISEYPNAPVFYNLKYNCLKRLGKMEEAYNFLLFILSTFPNYLFAKLDLIQHRLNKGIKVDLNEFFGDVRNLKSLYPSRRVFHISEFTKFIDTMISYHLSKDEIPEAFAYSEELVKTGYYFKLLPNTYAALQKSCADESSKLLDSIGGDHKLLQELIHDVVKR